MSKSEDDSIGDDERRFQIMEMPDDTAWPCKLPESLLAKADAETREYFIQMDRNAQKNDWCIFQCVNQNNKSYYMESDVIRSRKFRTMFLIRFATLNVVFGMLITIFGVAIKDKILTPRQQTNEPVRNK